MKAKHLLIFVSLVTGAQGAVITNALEDNFINKGTPNTVLGVKTVDMVDFPGEGANVDLRKSDLSHGNSGYGYYKFDISSITTADGTSAVFSVATGGGGSDYLLTAYVLNGGVAGYNWAENTITWNNSPALSTTATNFVDSSKVTEFANTQTVVSGASGTPTGTRLNFTLPNWDDYRQADDTLTILVVATGSTTNTLSLNSSESGRLPTFTTMVVPEPSSAALLLLGGLILARRKR